MSDEAQQKWQYLGKEPTGALAAGVLEAGGRSVNGSTRYLITKQREGLRYKVLSKALAEHADRDARPVTVFPSISDDKCAGRWLLATLSQDLGISSAAFKEALSAHLCLPSPAVRDGGWVI